MSAPRDPRGAMIVVGIVVATIIAALIGLIILVVVANQPREPYKWEVLVEYQKEK
jgi:hypothetical protein